MIPTYQRVSRPDTRPPGTGRPAMLPPLGEAGEGFIRWTDSLGIALGTLRANPRRTFLTMLGVIIGVAAVVALLAIGTGASAAITSSVAGSGSNVVTILPGSPTNRGPGSTGTAQTLTLADAEAIAALGLPVIGVAPEFSSSVNLVAPAADASAQVVGVTADYAVVQNLTVARGSFIATGQVRSVEPVVVLGNKLAQTLFGSGQAVGQTVRANGQPLRVIGVLAPVGGGLFGSTDDRAYVPITVAQQRLFGGRTPDGNDWRVSVIGLAARDSAQLPMIQEQASRLLRERHRLPADGRSDDFNFLNQTTLLNTLNIVTTLLTIFLAAVAGISLVVGGIGIMNIMLVSVTERTREIGLRKALGGREGDILTQFLIEALVISVTGGLIGLAVGVVVSLAVTLTGLLTASVSVGSVVLAVGFALAVGLFFGISPARAAARLNPIDALRHE